MNSSNKKVHYEKGQPIGLNVTKGVFSIILVALIIIVGSFLLTSNFWDKSTAINEYVSESSNNILEMRTEWGVTETRLHVITKTGVKKTLLVERNISGKFVLREEKSLIHPDAL